LVKSSRIIVYPVRLSVFKSTNSHGIHFHNLMMSTCVCLHPPPRGIGQAVHNERGIVNQYTRGPAPIAVSRVHRHRGHGAILAQRIQDVQRAWRGFPLLQLVEIGPYFCPCAVTWVKAMRCRMSGTAMPSRSNSQCGGGFSLSEPRENGFC
jgi:hypothetical protein